MRKNGFTLVELITVIAIMSILLSLATLQFNAMQKKSAIEREVVTIYSNLAEVRLQALYSKTPRTVSIVGNQFSIYSSQVTSVPPVSVISLSYPVVMTAGTGDRVQFDSSGMMLDIERSICVVPTGTLADNPGNTDSVAVFAAKIYMGKRRSGEICDPTNIDQK